MERAHFVTNFSRRLTSVMQEAGLGSSNSRAGVRINKLAEMSGCSLQMARRYALGEALPDIDATYKIASWLKVSPGWLLFGEETQNPNIIGEKDLICIPPELLEYVLLKSSKLFSIATDVGELVSFIMDIIKDSVHIEADRKAILKVIDISITSALRFNGTKHDKKATPTT